MAQDDEVQEFMKKRISELRKAADIMEGQLANAQESKIWLKSMKNKNIGGDVSKMVADVHHLTETGTIRRTTWAKAGNKNSARYTQNTMGYTFNNGKDSMDI
ncbi:hypothetical protein B0H11DRAFT_1933173 [Mycena galericulata]|nr:hypothetical protein B0H11DRAFT_1933173 [Mycena galericulata]